MSDLISRMEVLNWLYSVWDGQITSLFPGINSLPSAEKAQLSEEDATKDATSGLIRRQDAIDAVEFGITYAKAIDVNTGESKELFKEGNDALKKAVERLKELPSAEPEIIRCKDCKYRKVNEHYGEKGYMNLKAICELDTGDIFQLGRYAEEDDWFCADAERREGDTDEWLNQQKGVYIK